MPPSKCLSTRIQNLQRLLKKANLDACIITDSYDLYYLTGLKLSLGQLFVGQRAGTLFVDGRYFEIASKQSPVSVKPLEEKEGVSWLKGKKRVAFNPQTLSYAQYLSLRKLGRKAHSSLISSPELYTKIRLIKGPEELAKMRASAKFAYKAYQEIRKRLRPGITELELAKQLEIYCLENGAEKMSFEPIIAFGKNSSLPHHHPGNTVCKENDIALFDLGVVLDGYCSDMTRVDFVGKKDPKLEKIFKVNKEAQQAALSLCKPGVRLKELDEAARKVMRKENLESYYVHSLGHGVGLEVHEFPRVSKAGVDKNLPLEEGMVITLEPGIYLPGKGGVRYEDTVAITHEGVENFYPNQ